MKYAWILTCMECGRRRPLRLLSPWRCSGDCEGAAEGEILYGNVTLEQEENRKAGLVRVQGGASL